MSFSCSPIEGAAERIASLRSRHKQVTGSIAHYEARVASQAVQLERMNKPSGISDDEYSMADEERPEPLMEEAPVTEDDLEQEREEIRALEEKKKILEERVNSMQKDLGGLLR